MKTQLYWHGTPVPYVALWSSEEHSHIAPCEYAGGRNAIFSSGERGVGQPVWGKMEERRQRMTVHLKRCQVCNCKLTGERAFGMDLPCEMENSGRRFPALTEPPVCLQCVRYTLDLCPGNRRRAELGQLVCYELFEWITICQVLTHAPAGSPSTPSLERLLGPGETCIGMNKAMLLRYKRLSFDELHFEVGRC